MTGVTCETNWQNTQYEDDSLSCIIIIYSIITRFLISPLLMKLLNHILTMLWDYRGVGEFKQVLLLWCVCLPFQLYTKPKPSWFWAKLCAILYQAKRFWLLTSCIHAWDMQRCVSTTFDHKTLPGGCQSVRTYLSNGITSKLPPTSVNRSQCGRFFGKLEVSTVVNKLYTAQKWLWLRLLQGWITGSFSCSNQQSICERR